MTKKRQKRILIADDDRGARGSMHYILESSGYDIDTVETAARAMSKIKDKKYDLLVLDIALPGNMATRLFEILKQNEKYSRIPILFLLGPRSLEMLSDDRQETIAAADAYMQKPVRAEAFLAIVDRLIGRGEHGKQSRPPKSTDRPARTFRIFRRRQTAPMKTLTTLERKEEHE